MYHDLAPRLAQILTEYSHPIQKDDYVLISASTEAEPLIRALYEAVLRRGGHPLLRVQLPGLEETYYNIAADHQLERTDPLMMFVIDKVDVMYSIMAPSNTKNMSTIDPAITARAQRARLPFIKRYFERQEDGSLRWNISAWPTHSAAQEAEMGLMDYTEFIYKACGLHHDDPLAWWNNLKDQQERLVNFLADKSHAEVRGPGIELSFDFNDRLWINSWGSNNFPSGEIFTGPIEDSVNGHVAFNFPTNYGGRQISGVKLTFKDGKVIEASADKGESYLLTQLDMDEGARYLGEFAIGTNTGIQQFTGNTLFDEKIGGTIHMALGKSIPESKGVNVSAIHWDMVHNMKNGGEILIDGEPFYKNGTFLLFD